MPWFRVGYVGLKNLHHTHTHTLFLLFQLTFEFQSQLLRPVVVASVCWTDGILIWSAENVKKIHCTSSWKKRVWAITLHGTTLSVVTYATTARAKNFIYLYSWVFWICKSMMPKNTVNVFLFYVWSFLKMFVNKCLWKWKRTKIM